MAAKTENRKITHVDSQPKIQHRVDIRDLVTISNSWEPSGYIY